MYSTQNEDKSVVSERFIGTCKTKIYKYMTSIYKNMYNDKLNAIVNEYNSTYYKTIRMNPVHVNSSADIDFNVENDDKDPRFKVGNHVIILRYK